MAGRIPWAPWRGRGPYLWSDGTPPNGAGIARERADFREDGADHHPGDRGRTEVADALHRFSLGFDWYRR